MMLKSLNLSIETNFDALDEMIRIKATGLVLTSKHQIIQTWISFNLVK